MDNSFIPPGEEGFIEFYDDLFIRNNMIKTGYLLLELQENALVWILQDSYTGCSLLTRLTLLL